MLLSPRVVVAGKMAVWAVIRSKRVSERGTREGRGREEGWSERGRGWASGRVSERRSKGPANERGRGSVSDRASARVRDCGQRDSESPAWVEIVRSGPTQWSLRHPETRIFAQFRETCMIGDATWVTKHERATGSILDSNCISKERESEAICRFSQAGQRRTRPFEVKTS